MKILFAKPMTPFVNWNTQIAHPTRSQQDSTQYTSRNIWRKKIPGLPILHMFRKTMDIHFIKNISSRCTRTKTESRITSFINDNFQGVGHINPKYLIARLFLSVTLPFSFFPFFLLSFCFNLVLHPNIDISICHLASAAYFSKSISKCMLSSDLSSSHFLILFSYLFTNKATHILFSILKM